MLERRLPRECTPLLRLEVREVVEERRRGRVNPTSNTSWGLAVQEEEESQQEALLCLPSTPPPPTHPHPRATQLPQLPSTDNGLPAAAFLRWERSYGSFPCLGDFFFVGYLWIQTTSDNTSLLTFFVHRIMVYFENLPIQVNKVYHMKKQRKETSSRNHRPLDHIPKHGPQNQAPPFATMLPGLGGGFEQHH